MVHNKLYICPNHHLKAANTLVKRYPKVLTICQPMLRKETPSSPIHNYINVITITTLPHLPLLFLFWCHQINRCYIYNIHYYPQRCQIIALPSLFSNLFRCGYVCCFLYTYRARASEGNCCIYHTLFVTSRHQWYPVFYTTQSQFTLLTLLYFLQHSYVVLCTA